MASQVIINGSSSGSKTNAPTQAEINAIVQAKNQIKDQRKPTGSITTDISDLSKLSSLSSIANNNTPTVPTYKTNLGLGGNTSNNNYSGSMAGNSLSKAYIDSGSSQGITLQPYTKSTGDNGKNGGDVPVTYNYTNTTPVNDYYSQLLDLFTNTNEQARQNQIDAIMKNLSATKKSYKNRIQQVMDEYDALIDQNEVNKFRAKKVIRENQANRGQLDSGLGRQEQLQMRMNYDNNANDIYAARQSAINEIYNLITQAEAEAENNKATVNNTYANALLQYQLANQ